MKPDLAKPDLETGNAPKYQQIATWLADAIANGTLQVGEKLPPQRSLAYELSVTIGTITRAYGELEKRQLVRAEVGRGTYVLPKTSQPKISGENLTEWNITNTHQNILESQYQGLNQNPDDPFVDLSLNYLSLGADLDYIRQTLVDIAHEDNLENLMGYCCLPHINVQAHLKAGAEFLSWRGLRASADDILVTQGGHSGLVAVMAARTQAGNVIVTDSITYPGIRAIASMLDLQLCPIPMDDDGMIPDELEKVLHQASIRLIYLVPVLQNPTNTIMPLDRRQQIIKLAKKYHCEIVEDDPFALMVEDPPPAIASIAPEQTFYVTSVSKFISPGLRTGYVLTPPLYRNHIAAAIRANSWMTPFLGVEVTTRLMQKGLVKTILSRHRQEAISRLNSMRRILHDVKIIAPPGAVSGWVELPKGWTPELILQQAESHQIRLSDSRAFIIDTTLPDQHIRICLGPPRARDRFEGAIKTLAQIFQSGPPIPNIDNL